MFSIKGLVKSALVITLDRYWFVTDYILLYTVSPILNRMIRAMNKKEHFLCCGVLILVFSVFANFAFVMDVTGVDYGYSLTWFCVLYLIAAYFRLYIPEKTRYQKWLIIVYAILACVISGERFAAHIITPYIFEGVVLSSFFYSYNSVIMLPCAIALFQWFRGITIRSRCANKSIPVIASLTFAVYLIHQQPELKSMLWNWLGLADYAQSPWMMPWVIACVIGVFTVCCVTEWLRQKLFKFCRIDQMVARLSDRLQLKVENWLTAETE